VSARVVPAAKEHLNSIVRIERESFSDPWSEQAFIGMIDSPLAIVLVAAAADESVIGYAAATGAWEDGEILNVAVSGTARRQGIGGMLLDAAISALREQRVSRVFLEVRESNAAARGLYESRGFAEISVRRGYYRRPVEDAVVMKLELRTSTAD
jgi:ribosomal-protein-alanine N-acetyltransferase